MVCVGGLQGLLAYVSSCVSNGYGRVEGIAASSAAHIDF